MDHLLSWTTFVPAIGAALVLLLPKQAEGATKAVALAASLVSAALVALVVARFDPSSPALQLVERASWIPTISAEYHLGVDGLSILLVVLTALVVPVSMLASWSGTKNPRVYLFFVLLLQSGMYGVFTAQGFFHWFLFWEIVLVPAFFLVKMWGGAGSDRASLKFFLYTLVGSVAMLIAFQAILLATGTLDFAELAALGRSGELAEKLAGLAARAGLSWSATTCAAAAFAAIVLAAAIKTPMWPFHTWLPDAYAEAPTPVTMLLTAGMSKMGVYALLRIALPLFPAVSVEASQALLALAVVTVVAGAFAALAQTDLKRMMAYSSVNHVGYCLLGIFAAASVGGTALDRAAALDGVVLQMFNHGVTAAALFFLLHALEQRTGARGLHDFGGLRKVAPRFCLLFGVALFSSLGLPGLNGFVGEFLVFRGAFAIAPVAAAISTVGLVVTAVFLLTIMQRVWSGPTNERVARVVDLSPRELFGAGLLALVMFFVGIHPAPLVRRSDASAHALAGVLDSAAASRADLQQEQADR